MKKQKLTSFFSVADSDAIFKTLRNTETVTIKIVGGFHSTGSDRYYLYLEFSFTDSFDFTSLLWLTAQRAEREEAYLRKYPMATI